MNRSDFVIWRSDPITKAFFLAIQNKIEEGKEELSVTAGKDSYMDALRSGAIQACKDILDNDWFEETEK